MTTHRTCVCLLLVLATALGSAGCRPVKLPSNTSSLSKLGSPGAMKNVLSQAESAAERAMLQAAKTRAVPSEPVARVTEKLSQPTMPAVNAAVKRQGTVEELARLSQQRDWSQLQRSVQPAKLSALAKEQQIIVAAVRPHAEKLTFLQKC